MWSYSEDIGMKFGIDKCALLELRNRNGSKDWGNRISRWRKDERGTRQSGWKWTLGRIWTPWIRLLVSMHECCKCAASDWVCLGKQYWKFRLNFQYSWNFYTNHFLIGAYSTLVMYWHSKNCRCNLILMISQASVYIFACGFWFCDDYL